MAEEFTLEQELQVYATATPIVRHHIDDREKFVAALKLLLGQEEKTVEAIDAVLEAHEAVLASGAPYGLAGEDKDAALVAALRKHREALA